MQDYMPLPVKCCFQRIIPL